MTDSLQRRVGIAGGVLLLALAVLLLMVSTAGAAAPLTQLQRAHGGADVTYAAASPSQLERAHGGADVTYALTGPVGGTANVGRGGVFVRTPPAPVSTAAAAGGIAVSALVVALVAFLGLRRRASRRGDLAPVTSIAEAPSASPASRYEDRERKAA